MSSVKFKGVPLDFGDRKIIVPGLSLRQLRENAELVKECVRLESMPPGPDQIFAMLDPVSKLVHLAVSRNYGDKVTLEDVLDVLDTHTAQEFVGVIMGQTGFKRVHSIEEGDAPGEA